MTLFFMTLHDILRLPVRYYGFTVIDYDIFIGDFTSYSVTKMSLFYNTVIIFGKSRQHDYSITFKFNDSKFIP